MKTVTIAFTASGRRDSLTTQLGNDQSAKDVICQTYDLDPSQVQITGITRH